MRFSSLTLLVAGAFALGACAGDAERAVDTTTAGTHAPPDGTTSGAPITGRIHEVRMLFDGARYYFDPEALTVRRGDGVRWTMVSGAPHNVQFLPSEIPEGAAAVLAENMPRPDAPLTGPMLLSENEQYIVSFANVPRGTYGYICTPHQMVGMKGSIEVE